MNTLFISIIIGLLILAMSFFLIYSFLPTAFIRIMNLVGKLSSIRTGEGIKEIYLTFDDGPDEKYTPKLLDLLRENEIHATFFIVTDFAEKSPQIIERMRMEGHYIALHSKNHHCPLFEIPSKINRNFEDSLRTMRELNCPVEIVRPAWGTFNLNLLRKIKEKQLQIVLWNVMAEDWKGDITSVEIEKRLLQRIYPGSIVCLHDGRGKNNAPSRTVDALSRVIPELKRQGYTFKTIGER